MQSGKYGTYYTSNVSLSPAEQKINAQYAWRWAAANGWSINAFCGMAGNFRQEATFNPGRWQGGRIKDSSGFGIVQWTPSTKFRNWAKENELDENSLDAQLARIEWELANGEQYIKKSSYPLTFAQFKVSTESPSYLAKAFGVNYERSGAILAGGNVAEESLNSRAAYAEEVYEWVKDIPLEAPEAPAPVDYPNGAAAVVIATRGTTVNFREQPSLESGEIIARIPVGSAVTVYRKEQIWCEVEYQGNRGYMMTEFLDITEPPDTQPDEPDDTQDTILVQREALVAIRNTINVLLGE